MSQSNPFALSGSLGLTPIKPLNRLFESTLEAGLGLRTLQRLYRNLPAALNQQAFLDEALKTLQLEYYVSQGSLDEIPETGPAVIVANHPFGGLEGIILAHLLLQRRKDVRIVANQMLGRISELSELFIQVNPFASKQAIQQNRGAVRQAMNWVSDGGLLVIFPAGEVSHLHIKQRAIMDPEWRELAARVILHTDAPVIPLRFIGSNSMVFQCAGLIHDRLRTALLPREMLRKQSSRIELRIGRKVGPHQFRNMQPAVLTQQLRLLTEALADSARKPGAVAGTADGRAVMAARAVEHLQAEIEQLTPEQKLATAGSLSVYLAPAAQIPCLLEEIGRCRELTLRAVGEGTGQSIDLDDYDNYYEHLFIWDEIHQRLVGAYRLGRSDEIYQNSGLRGLYSHSLFKYRSGFLKRIGPAVELGRSFIVQDYQKSFTPLLLLWKGIGAFLLRNPHYRTLFGPVSISNDYAGMSQKLMVDFLLGQCSDHELARLVKPRRKFDYRGVKVLHQADLTQRLTLDRLSDLIACLEADQKGIPILLKQYLKLGGEILGFNVDEKFSNTLDGLILVHLDNTDERLLSRYMGQQGAADYLAYTDPVAGAA